MLAGQNGAENMIYFCNLCIIISLYIKYDLWIKYSKAIDVFSNFESIISTGQWQNLLFEFFLNIVSPQGFLQNMRYVEYVEAFDVSIHYEVNELLLAFSFVRIYLIMKLYIYYTESLTPRSQRVCEMNGCDSDVMFAIKSIIKSQPYKFLLYSLTLTTFVFGYLLHIFEGPMTEISGQNYRSMYSCMWNVIITLSTVGYGEIYPKTFFGRITGVIICFWGVFILSLFVVTITDSLEFSSNEDKSFSLLVNLLYKKQLKVQAVSLIEKAYRYKMVKKTESNNVSRILSQFQNFRQQILNFQEII